MSLGAPHASAPAAIATDIAILFPLDRIPVFIVASAI
jgi:hypothetical protein